jgi:hypothetical protein
MQSANNSLFFLQMLNQTLSLFMFLLQMKNRNYETD